MVSGLIVMVVLPVGGAHGEVPRSREVAREAFTRAERAAKEMRFPEALAGYEEAARGDPTAPFAPVAQERADDLRAHAEGEFRPLARLESVRRDPGKNRDATEIAALEEEARAFPDGRVRSEALLVVAQAYAHALGKPDQAIGALDRILTDSFAERTTRTLALGEVVTLYRAKGDLAGATLAVNRDPELLPSLTREVRVLVRREWIARGCLGLLGVLALLAVWGGVAGARRLGDVRQIVPLVVRPGALAFAFYVGGGGAIFVRVYGGEGDPLPFLGLGLGVALVGVLVRAWALAEGQRTRRGAVIRAVVAGAGMLATAYLILWKVSGDYLTPLGL